MKFLGAIFLAYFCTQTFAQNFTLDQSSSSVEWETISNNYVKLIYPNNLKQESIYIANLINHYSNVVGLSYNIYSPKKFTLVLRPELSSPNGFVGFGPRRSEWFSSSSFSTFVGSSEWYQTLAIHEYRHVIQLDKYSSTIVNVGDLLFGDLGKTFLLFSGLQPWVLEGDAVWAETKYTDAGRGRSPYFLARLKALVLSNDIPTYNELVNGTYNTSLPNHYVFGYMLISSATNKYGEDFWNKVLMKVASSPHPFRLYCAFKEEAGISFYDFYDLTIKELRLLWGKDLISNQQKSEFRLNKYPFKSGNIIYYLRKDLDSHWSIFKRENDKSDKISEIAFIEALSHFHIERNLATFVEFNVDKRYAYKGSSDIVVIDLNSKIKTRLTSGQRFYNPRFNKDASKIIAVHFRDDHKWSLAEINLEGKITREFLIPNFKFSEAAYISDNEVVAITNDLRGYKSIQKINLDSKQTQVILEPSRNNIYSLNVDNKNNLYFEAQFKGYVNIFNFDLNNSNILKQCTYEKIAAYSPFSDGENLYFSTQDSNGTKIAQVQTSKCEIINRDSLINFNYLTNSPSDNYNKFPIQNFDEQVEMYSKEASNYKPQTYGDFDSRLFTPHSWNFFGARGFILSGTTNNYLRTMGINATIGRDAEEKEIYGELSIDYKKYYPLFNLSIGSRNRSVDIYNYSYDLEWNEKEAKFTTILPYSFSSGLYNLESYLYASASYLDNSEYEIVDTDYTYKDKSFTITTAGFNFAVGKQMSDRSIMNPYLFSLETIYSNAKNDNSENFSSYRFNLNSRINIPGFFKNDGFFATFTFEKKKDNRLAYQFLSTVQDVNGYVFSRGYDYEAVSTFNKVTANYAFPIAYPDFDLNLLYFLQIKSNLFFDTTKIDSIYASATLNSYGVEIEFETKLFRILPLDFGIRYVRTLKDNEVKYEGSVGSSINY